MVLLHSLESEFVQETKGEEGERRRRKMLSVEGEGEEERLQWRKKASTPRFALPRSIPLLLSRPLEKIDVLRRGERRIETF